MAKRRRKTTEATIENRIKQKRGQGRGSDYIPWLLIQDVPSSGLVQRIKGAKTGRIHHLMSQLEAWYFYLLEWSLKVIDIREQYPLLPQSETLDLAGRCGVRHPADPRTRHPVVMTTDFVVTLRATPRPIEVARTIKPAAMLDKKRVQEKLEIERRFWQRRGIDWRIVTERELPIDLARNVELLHRYINIDDRLNEYTQHLPTIVGTLNEWVEVDPHQPARQLAQRCETQLRLPPGVGLAVIYHLLATRQWYADLQNVLNPARQLSKLRINIEGNDVNSKFSI